jgi:tellurite methyltransferase
MSRPHETVAGSPPAGEPSDQLEERNWARYYDAMAGKPPRETLLAALARAEGEPVTRERFAVDLGCGEGRDTVELLRRGWRVLAIDGEPEAITRLLSRTDLPPDARLETRVARYDSATWPEVDLLNSSFALPFCPPEHWASLWQRIVESIRPGGRFAGHLFGERDEWGTRPEHTCLTRAQVEAMLRPFDIEMLEESEEDGQTAIGRPKHWHLFEIVARKR